LQKTVKVTRKGQTTIPAEIREKLGIKEGDALTVETKDKQIIFTPVPTLEEMCGIFAGHADVAELKKENDKIREEY
jgi:antitoxin PrlF